MKQTQGYQNRPPTIAKMRANSFSFLHHPSTAAGQAHTVASAGRRSSWERERFLLPHHRSINMRPTALPLRRKEARLVVSWHHPLLRSICIVALLLNASLRRVIPVISPHALHAAVFAAGVAGPIATGPCVASGRAASIDSCLRGSISRVRVDRARAVSRELRVRLLASGTWEAPLRVGGWTRLII
ncbi:hypothetical protein EJ06DRAFT_294036 [Trichodelitschia bisporula]|uniref:Uncharacterized protein n=1 Tax=Trichodelitschia bisporula TaxID=703511 RepID=A0A6G1I6V6_9PEZI|nr:hypothetical protein EJ06DRAFT_294036 [Trichodelitschia bisporula]